jgi:metal-sulfur cluster biosynthetic enzyme
VTTADEVRNVLNGIIDPCSTTAGVPAGLADMGLVSGIAVTGVPGAERVCVTVGVTEPSCLMLGSFAAEARARLLALPGVEEVDLTLDSGFTWTEERLQPDYRRRLAEGRTSARLRRALPVIVELPGPRLR